ncbi:family 2 glycosyl transferase [Planomonospora sp. ID82291]|uniref:family 2 glycosyl transferase n=1 Tax=Planomonospora sp. ID82291 TaxID=2738136 RepID=UPI0018C364E4|nr:family 2 glycosyl transferase [Planomonospora sp. ID82291]MBG0813046.1 family 2 glycosyl transferase [Planomonospora sp. ID82291]
MTAVVGLDARGTGPTPAGFVRNPPGEVVPLRWEHGRWTVPEGDPHALRGLRVHWPDRAADHAPDPAPDPAVDAAPGGPVAASRDPHPVLAPLLDLAAAGVPLHADKVPAWAVRADPVLADLLTEEDWLAEPARDTPHCTAALRREEHSVRLRRHGQAHRRGAVPHGTPAVSVVMASMRPHLLESALGQIARQRGVRAEVLLGLHGFAADHEAVRRAVGACPLPVTVVEADAATPFGDVLNLAAAAAGGDHVAKWDDDDWYGPDHLADLLLARAHSGAEIVGTAAEFFYLEPLNVTIRRTDYTSEVWSDHVAGGTILLDRDRFRETGGFPGLPRGVDAAFLKAAHAAGARIYRTHGLGYMLRRGVSARHTWQLPLAHFLRVASNQWRGFRPSRILAP